MSQSTRAAPELAMKTAPKSEMAMDAEINVFKKELKIAHLLISSLISLHIH